MKYIQDSFPYKPNQIIYWIKNNVIKRGLLLKSTIEVEAKYEDNQCILNDDCTLHILPDHEIEKKEPMVVHVDPKYAFFSLESALEKIVVHEHRTYNLARDRCGAW